MERGHFKAGFLSRKKKNILLRPEKNQAVSLEQLKC